MADTDLLPCPFCGGERAIAIPANRNSTERLYPIVRCMGCFIDVPGKTDDFSLDCRTAIAAWNRRAPSPSPAPGVVTDEIAEARRRLAAWDIGALPKDMTLLEIVDARISDLQRYQNMPFSLRDVERGLILFRTSNNAHGLTNFVSLTMKVEALPQAGKDELASMMRNIAEGLSPALASLSQPAKGEREGGGP